MTVLTNQTVALYDRPFATKFVAFSTFVRAKVVRIHFLPEEGPEKGPVALNIQPINCKEVGLS